MSMQQLCIVWFARRRQQLRHELYKGVRQVAARALHSMNFVLYNTSTHPFYRYPWLGYTIVEFYCLMDCMRFVTAAQLALVKIEIIFFMVRSGEKALLP